MPNGIPRQETMLWQVPLKINTGNKQEIIITLDSWMFCPIKVLSLLVFSYKIKNGIGDIN